MSASTTMLEPGPGSTDGAGDYRPAAQLFLRALGIVYLIVFASIAVQVRVLVGADGLLPAREFLAARADDGLVRFWRLPTVFWLWDTDVALRSGVLLGLALAVTLAVGWWPRASLIGLGVLFLSYVTVGRDFFWFQWDNLLLETTALALLLPAVPERPPHPAVVFLFRWLIFRLFFESGLAKVQGGSGSWLPLMAMASYYETAPLPSLGGWYAHQLPTWAHRVASAVTLLGELVGALMIWGPRVVRLLAFVLIASFQVGIQFTANYGYFNILSLALAVFLLDARDLAWLPRWSFGRGASRLTEAPSRPSRWRWAMWVAAGVIFALTVLEMLVLLARPGVAASPQLMALRELYAPFRLANSYHLFAHIDPRRVETEIEWTTDGERWHAYDLYYKPGNVRRAPRFVAPHQPRLDFQLWFFTLGRDGGSHAYFNTLVARLCTTPASVSQLFRPASVPLERPLALRVAYHRYWMTDLATQERTGAYWRRELLAYHPLAYFCDSPERPRF